MNIVIGIRNDRTSALQPNSSCPLKEGAKPTATVWLNDILRHRSTCSATV